MIITRCQKSPTNCVMVNLMMI